MLLRTMTARITAGVGAVALGAAGAAVTVVALQADADDTVSTVAASTDGDDTDGDDTDGPRGWGGWGGPGGGDAHRWLADRLDDLPDALRQDLEDAWDLDDPDARREAFEAIRDKALDGGYGADVAQDAQDLQDRWESWAGDGPGPVGPGGPFRDADGDLRLWLEERLGDLPDALVQDLEDAADIQDAEQRRDALADVRDRALAGDYGAEVEQRAKELRDRFEGLRDGGWRGGPGPFGGRGGGPFWHHDG